MSVVRKPGYKETAIGWIPADWSVAQVRELAEVDSESLSNKTAADFSFHYISLGDVESGKLVSGWDQITFSEAPSRARRIVKAADILFATVRPNLKGHYFARRADGNVIASTGFSVVRARAGEVSPEFLYQSLLSEGVDGQIEKLTVGSNYPAVNSADVKGLLLPAPPLAEQQKIAAILTAVDDKLDVIARQIESTQTLKRGLMQTLFSQGLGTQDADGIWGPHTEFKDSELGQVPIEWEVCTLDSVATVERGKFSARPRNDPRYFENGNIPFIQTGDVASATRYVECASQYLNEDGLKVSKQFPADTIFITIAANIGDVAIARIPMTCPDSLVGIRATSATCDNTWLYYLLANNKDYFDSQSTQNAQKNINLQVLKPFKFPMPTLKEQQQVAGVLTALDDKFDVLISRQTHYQTLKCGLMQKLLTGEWRVKPDAAEAVVA